MTVLITGGAGYLGSVLCAQLLEQGHTVRVLDRLLYGPAGLLPCCRSPRFEFINGDVRDTAKLTEAMQGADVLVPLAALVGMPLCAARPEEAVAVNFEAVATLNRLRSPNQRVLYPNTNSGYGLGTGELHCTEETPLEPISVYGRTKVDAERLLLESPNAVTFRFATLFGVSPRMRLDLLVNDFTWRALRDGYLVLYEKHFKRNYLHVEDAARCFTWAIEHWDAMVGRCYNAGLDDANLSKQELAEVIGEFVPNLKIHEAAIGEDPDKRNYIVSNERLYGTGYRPAWSLRAGIRQLLTAYELLWHPAAMMGPWRNA